MTELLLCAQRFLYSHLLGRGRGGAARLWFLAEEAAMLKTQREGTALKWAAEHAENTRISWLCKQTAESGEQREAYTEREQRRASELVSAADISGAMHTGSRLSSSRSPPAVLYL